MELLFDCVHGVWVAMGVYRGIPYLAEGDTEDEATENAENCAAEQHGKRIEL